MPAAPPFGRRARAHAPVAVAQADAFDPTLAAFRESLHAPPAAGEDVRFADWRRRRRTGRTAAWLLSFALMTPGAVCLFVDVPLSVSVAIELIGIGAGWWLRRARRRHLGEIVAWSSDEA